MVAVLGGNAFVSGAANGIGRATAFAYAKAGVDGLYLIDVNREALETVKTELLAATKTPGFRVEIEVVNVTNEVQVEKMAENFVKAFGRMDYAANIAGISEKIITPLADTATETYRDVQSVNTDGVFFCMRAQLRVMKVQEPVSKIPGRKACRGSIVNISSIASERVIPGLSSYTISKHGVSGMTRSAAFTHASDRIRVNAVAPGFVYTGMSFPVQVVTDWIMEAQPMGRYGKSEEVADVVLFLSGPKTSSVNGQVWYADGGFSACSKGAKDSNGSFTPPYQHPAYAPQR